MVQLEQAVQVDTEVTLGIKLQNLLGGGLLFLATAAVVLWQNMHLAVLWDLSYVLESAWRMAEGELPYRDFPFAHAPLTFAVQAVLIRLLGRHIFVHALYCAAAGGAGSVLSWRILLAVLRSGAGRALGERTLQRMALVLAMPLTVLGLYCILPHPSYDCDAALAVLVAVYCLQRLDRPGAGLRAGVLAGAVSVLPVFYKQNIGLPFLFAVVLLVAGLLLQVWLNERSNRPLRLRLAGVLAGAAGALALALALLQALVGLGNYLHWTIGFAASRRLPGLASMVGVYNCPFLFWLLPTVGAGLLLLAIAAGRRKGVTGWAGWLLLAAPWVAVLVWMWIDRDDVDSFGDVFLGLWPLILVLAAGLLLLRMGRLPRRNAQVRLTPLLGFVVLAAVHGTLMSQQLWGSTYALWPFFVILLGDCLGWLVAERATGGAGVLAESRALGLAAMAAVCLLAAGSLYTLSEERLSYVDLAGGPVVQAQTTALQGLATPGPYLRNLDELVDYAGKNIPLTDALLILPGEDPFYYATGRRAQFPVLLFDPATDPYGPADVLREVRDRQVKWMIVKTQEQIKEDPTPQREATLAALQGEFRLAARLRGYEVYRR